ncbi:MAG: GIY-YIG nuclease family protein [Candidatus Omnitrophica bacterium]|nr:GIY-YIG nuclease family protein [Candidatus Omnitrophota bacterium]
MNKLKEKIASLPDAAGVYIFKDAGGEIIYIGKANSLKKRVVSYLGRDLSTKTVALMTHVRDVEYRLCKNESLALLLEASLIHQYKPKYNVSLRDDKSFPFVKITNEEFPAIYITRKKEADGARYIGPYTNVKLLRQALKIIRRSFPYRSCRKLPQKACIYYRLKLSPAPCIGKIDKKEYAKIIEDIVLILEGKTDTLVKKWVKEMELKSKEQDFEAAAKMRDQISALSALSSTGSGMSQLEDLKDLLKLDRMPRRIEGFDISDISGEGACGSMVSFYMAEADKNNYRRFRIKTVEGIDDYKMLAEVISRRYGRLARENLSLPDLILIDGGRSHLLTAKKELEKLKLDIPLISIAKDRENIYTGGRRQAIRFDADTPALNLIRKVRDEAHRFALSYHHILRRKETFGR